MIFYSFIVHRKEFELCTNKQINKEFFSSFKIWQSLRKSKIWQSNFNPIQSRFFYLLLILIEIVQSGASNATFASGPKRNQHHFVHIYFFAKIFFEFIELWWQLTELCRQARRLEKNSLFWKICLHLFCFCYKNSIGTSSFRT